MKGIALSFLIKGGDRRDKPGHRSESGGRQSRLQPTREQRAESKGEEQNGIHGNIPYFHKRTGIPLVFYRTSSSLGLLPCFHLTPHTSPFNKHQRRQGYWFCLFRSFAPTPWAMFLTSSSTSCVINQPN